MVEKLTDVVDCLTYTSLLDMLGTNCMLTSWKDLALYDIECGYKLRGNIQAVRGYSNSANNGLQLIFPVLPDWGGGGWRLLSVSRKAAWRAC